MIDIGGNAYNVISQNSKMFSALHSWSLLKEKRGIGHVSCERSKYVQGRVLGFD